MLAKETDNGGEDYRFRGENEENCRDTQIELRKKDFESDFGCGLQGFKEKYCRGGDIGEAYDGKSENGGLRLIANNSNLLKAEGNYRSREGCKTRNFSDQVVKKFNQGTTNNQVNLAPTKYSGKPCVPTPGPRARSVISGYSSRSSNPHTKIRGQFQTPPTAHESNKISLVPLNSGGIIKVNPNIDLKSMFSDLSGPLHFS